MAAITAFTMSRLVLGLFCLMALIIKSRVGGAADTPVPSCHGVYAGFVHQPPELGCDEMGTVTSLIQTGYNVFGSTRSRLDDMIDGATTTANTARSTSTSLTSATPSLEKILEEASAIAQERADAEKRSVDDEQEHRDLHPFWDFDFGEVGLFLPTVMLCATVLSCSGFLCSVAGVGGNIIQVSVLMVMGQLSPHDAVPLSKVVVLSGTLGALAVHLRVGSGLWVNWELSRLAIPACLMGTVIGVSVNTRIPDIYIVCLLSIFLLSICVWVTIQAAMLYNCELQDAKQDGQDDGTLAPRRRASSSMEVTASLFALASPLDASFKPESHPPSKWDLFMAAALLVLVVASGILAELTSKCHDAVFMGLQENSSLKCQHPFLRIMFWGSMKGLALHRQKHRLFQLGCVFVPITACLVYGEYAAYQTLAKANPTSRCRVRTVQLFLFVMGFIGSLTGVGGGVALSPFFVMLGLYPQHAVATSSVCVIFISASSAFQYIITDRVKMALACIYSTANVAASIAGALSMHFVADRLARPSMVMALIGLAVLVSFGISLHRAFQMTTIHPITSD
eukprot:TRINITY_DN15400_c0_g1_i2.p1 TRINITY_DN15400_c0_g1~~TRINITY_DN15400_c0_g1_i2.p1  ORF type:complete len:566 (+),score=73.79 TRINITY_DN15400_c0_g1_i2:185-1882(+)